MKSFTATSLALVAAASLLPTAFAHGYVRTVTIGGKAYHGPQPGSKGKSTDVIREITNTNPNHLADAGADLACGRGAAKRGAAALATAKAGDTIQWTWDAGDGSPWPHNQGGMLTYMALCDGDCKTFDATKANWFKIDEVGKTKTPGNTWVQAQLMKGKDYSTKIPAGVPNGNYLIRHEIIALHLADKVNGAEFYPSCSQVTITGGAAAKTAVSPTVKFPGGYKQDDAGIHINIWDKLGAYPFPGPAIAKFDGSAVADSNSTSTSTTKGSTKTSTSAASTSTAAASDDGDDEDCTEEGDDDDSGDDNNDDDSDSGTSSGTTTLNGGSGSSTGTKTVTVTVTVTATPSSCATSGKGKANYARSPEPTTPVKARRSRSHGHKHAY